jgi:iron complex outermembrane receptor protein
MPTTVVATLAFANESRTDDAATFKVGVEWKPVIASPFVDKFMVYANTSTGFRSGSYNAEFIGSQAALTSLAPEKITAYETGVKTVLDDRKLLINASVYHYKFTDGFINVDSPTSPIPITINAADITTYGVEFDMNWRPIDQLTLGMGGGWLDAKIDSPITSGGRSLERNLDLAISADANFRSSQYFNSTNTPNALEPGYWLLNGRVAISGKDDRWSIGVFAKNLTKTVYRTYVNDLPGFGWLLNVYGNPRTFGLSASVKW